MIGFLLETGPHHPGQRMWVQRWDGKSAFDMTGERERAEIFISEAAALKRAKRYSTLYGLRVVAADSTR